MEEILKELEKLREVDDISTSDEQVRFIKEKIDQLGALADRYKLTIDQQEEVKSKLLSMSPLGHFTINLEKTVTENGKTMIREISFEKTNKN